MRLGTAWDHLFLVSLIYLTSLLCVAHPGQQQHHGRPLTGKGQGSVHNNARGDGRHLNDVQDTFASRTFSASSVEDGFLRLAGVGDSWCDAILGCLYLTDDWYSKAPYDLNFKVAFRALNFLPESRSKINTRFWLHTREANLKPYRKHHLQKQEIQIYDDASVVNSPFRSTRPTKFIIHGHLDSARKQWVEAMAKSLLMYGDFNVIRVDWGGGSQTIFSQALANTRVVGLEVAYLINWLARMYQLDTRDVHIIGHSLGAHIAGYAGEKITDLGRITGLDPAGTGFNTMPDRVHLDPSDAMFVDVIHSNAGYFALGTEEPMGHLDFFPNGGNNQPGCNLLTKLFNLLMISFRGDMLSGLRQVFACSHDKSIDFYMDTLHDPYAYIGHECHDFKSFKKGDCDYCGYNNNRCAPMGIAADDYVQHNRKYVIMYLDT
ncbi:unnamed protein product [Meganyctiphanes norvegica]|uniref:Lipase domain-containing protein n=1 Tax=Meganyctiphanes norvegica TaxID=48144 RepID=A0AAV2Q463_MEGNR